MSLSFGARAEGLDIDTLVDELAERAEALALPHLRSARVLWKLGRTREALAQLLASQLFGASAGDVLAFAGGIAVLVVAAVVACAAPVQRATRVAPIDALRDE